MAKYYIADIVGPDTVIVQGDSIPIKIAIKDTFVDWQIGQRVLLSDLGYGGNQYVAVRNCSDGLIPLPPTPVPSLVQTNSFNPDILRTGNRTFAAAWAKTIRYDLSYYDPVIQGITGTAYATLVSRPADFRELLPFGSHKDLPRQIRGRLLSYVNLVTGGDYAQKQLLKTRRKGDPATFTYQQFPNTARFNGFSGGSIWEDPVASVFGLQGMLPPNATVSLSLIAILIGGDQERGLIPGVPVDLKPEDVFTEFTDDVQTVARLTNSLFFQYKTPPRSRVVYVGSNPLDVGITEGFTTRYDDVTDVLKDAV